MRFKIDWASLTVGSKLAFWLCFNLYLTAIFQVQAPGGLNLKGRFNGGFFALPDWGAYIWRGLYVEGLIFGIFNGISSNLQLPKERLLININVQFYMKVVAADPS